MSDPNDIRPFADEDGKPMSNEELLAYLDGLLPEAEAHELEMRMAADGANADALEGLQSLGAQETRKLQNQINQRLRQSLKKKKGRRRGIASQYWIWLAVIVILLLAVTAFGVLHFMKKP